MHTVPHLDVGNQVSGGECESWVLRSVEFGVSTVLYCTVLEMGKPHHLDACKVTLLLCNATS